MHVLEINHINARVPNDEFMSSFCNHISKVKLNRLAMIDLNISEEEFSTIVKYVKDWRSIVELDLSESDITEDGVAMFVSACAGLTITQINIGSFNFL